MDLLICHFASAEGVKLDFDRVGHFDFFVVIFVNFAFVVGVVCEDAVDECAERTEHIFVGVFDCVVDFASGEKVFNLCEFGH